MSGQVPREPGIPFSTAARTCLRASEEEARQLHSPTINEVHLLLAVARDETVGPALADGGLTVQRLHEWTGWSSEEAGLTADHPVVFSREVKDVLERALRQRVREQDRLVQTRHLLLGLLQYAADRGGQLARVLADLNLDLALLTDAVGDFSSPHESAPLRLAADTSAALEARLQAIAALGSSGGVACRDALLSIGARSTEPPEVLRSVGAALATMAAAGQEVSQFHLRNVSALTYEAFCE